MFYILWYAPGWEEVTAQYIGGEAGKGVAEIAKLLGLHWGVYHVGSQNGGRDGQRALKERKATGRPPILDCKRHGKAILKLVKLPATEYGYEHPLWTCQRIRQVISAELNLVVSVPTLWREPDFNPDEGVWSHLKSQELKAHQATNKEELIKKTHEALKRMAKRPALIRSFFKRCNIT